MKRALIAGVRYQPFRSWPVISQSDDGITWDDPIDLFDIGDGISGLATNGTTVAISNTRGLVSTSTDMVNYVTNEIKDGFGVQDIGYQNGIWLAVGQQVYVDAYGPYPSMSAVSQIYSASAPSSAWSMIWSNESINSCLYQIKWFQSAPIANGLTADVWVAVGSAASVGEIWYSLDNGTSWANAAVPAGVGPLLSVGLYRINAPDQWYWGCHGQLFKSGYLNDQNWSQISLNGYGPITQIDQQGGAVLIAGKDRIYSSIDGDYFKSWEYPGYVFDQIGAIENDGSWQWMVFARSLLTQHTQWSSTDLISWTPNNNGIHVSRFVLRP